MSINLTHIVNTGGQAKQLIILHHLKNYIVSYETIILWYFLSDVLELHLLYRCGCWEFSFTRTRNLLNICFYKIKQILLSLVSWRGYEDVDSTEGGAMEAPPCTHISPSPSPTPNHHHLFNP